MERHRNQHELTPQIRSFDPPSFDPVGPTLAAPLAGHRRYLGGTVTAMADTRVRNVPCAA